MQRFSEQTAFEPMTLHQFYTAREQVSRERRKWLRGTKQPWPETCAKSLCASHPVAPAYPLFSATASGKTAAACSLFHDELADEGPVGQVARHNGRRLCRQQFQIPVG